MKKGKLNVVSSGDTTKVNNVADTKATNIPEVKKKANKAQADKPLKTKNKTKAVSPTTTIVAPNRNKDSALSKQKANINKNKDPVKHTQMKIGNEGKMTENVEQLASKKLKNKIKKKNKKIGQMNANGKQKNKNQSK